jgi:glycosyltransferase 2 family protein
MKNLIKIAVTVAIFIYLFRYINFDALVAILAKSHGGMIFIALLLQLASTYVAAYRWSDIGTQLHFHEQRSFYAASYFKGVFFNQVLPSSIGGDAVRVLDLSRKGYGNKDSFYAVFMDRVVGLTGLLVLNLAASLLFFGIFERNFSLLLISIATLGLAGFASLFFFNRIAFLQHFKVLNLLFRLANRINTLYSDKTVLAKHIALSVVVWLLTVMSVYGIALSIDVKLGLETFLIAVPPVFLLMIIPISLAGWGIREGAMIGIFMLIYDDKTKILAISILYGILLILSSLPGAYFWIKSKRAT